MATTSTASRTACTSWGVMWTLPRGMGHLPPSSSRPAERHHRRAVSPFVRCPGADLGDATVRPQMLAHGLAQTAGAVAMDHPHLLAGGEERLIEIGVELLQRRLHPQADQVDLP